MSDRLSFWEALALQATELQDQGFLKEARLRFEHLLSMPALPNLYRLRCLTQLAQLDLAAQRYRSARRCLYAALALDENHLEARELLAEVIEADPKASPKRALKHRLYVAQQEPDSISSHLALAHLACRLDLRKPAMKLLRRIERLGLESIFQIEQVLTLWLDLGRFRMARRFLNRHRFQFCKQPGWKRLERVVGYQHSLEAQTHQDCKEAVVLQFPNTVSFIRQNDAGEASILPMVREHNRSTPTPHLFSFRNSRSDPRRPG